MGQGYGTLNEKKRLEVNREDPNNLRNTYAIAYLPYSFLLLASTIFRSPSFLFFLQFLFIQNLSTQ